MMATIYRFPKHFSPPPHSEVKELVRGDWNWKSLGAIGGLLGGLIAPIAGSFVTLISWFRDLAWHGLSLRSAGTVLFVLTLPLLTFGAHCLDLLDKEKNQAYSTQLVEPKDTRTK